MANSDADKLDAAVARIEAVILTECPQPSPKLEQALELLRTRLNPVLKPLRPPPLNRPNKEWVDALRKQAQRDLDAAMLLGSKDHAGACTMLLQMTFEKLAKAALAKTEPHGFRAHRRSHAVASKFLQTLHRVVDTKWRSPLRLAKSITNAHPALAKDGPHLEYPWEGAESAATRRPSRDRENSFHTVRRPDH